jgi:hypothetical protein
MHQLANALEERLAALREAITQALGAVAGSTPAFSRNDGNVLVALPRDETVQVDGPEFNDNRTICVYIHEPTRLTLYSGFGLQMRKSGRLRVFGGHVVSAADGLREVVWSCSRVVWPESAEQEHVFAEIVSGANEHLRAAIERLVKLAEAAAQ